MPAYVIVIRERVQDTESLKTYSELAARAPREKLTRLAIYGTQKVLEGPQNDGVVILQFPTLADAEQWYHSPAYQAALAFRRKGGDYRVILVEGV